MTWRMARSLDLLLRSVDQRAPNRSKSSDGGIGDAAHASRSSDHNPWVKDSVGNGVVTARDFTHDPANGFDCEAFADALAMGRDPRIKYIIWNRRIISSKDWVWRSYHGANPHTLHAHVSVSETLYDDIRPWMFKIPGANPAVPKVVDRPRLRLGDKGDRVKRLQQLLGVTVDGEFGPATEEAVRTAQRKYGLVDDGIVGPYTWNELFS